MFVSLRTWLARLLVPELAAPKVPEPPRELPRETPKSKNDDADAKNARRLERRRREAEERAEKAEERTRTVEKEKRAAEGNVAGAERRANDAEARARRLEAEIETLRKAANAEAERAKIEKVEKKQDGKLEKKLEAAEARLAELTKKAARAEKRADDLTAEREAFATSLSDVNAQLTDALARAAAAPVSDPRGPASAPTSANSAKLDAHFSPGDACLVVICEELAAANESADLCVFTITDDRISRAVLDAHRRGVRVRIITDDDKSLDEGSDIKRLARAGIAVRHDRSPFHMHHKFAVFDGRSMLTGSYNWTRGAAEKNQENLVVSDDQRLLKPFRREFETLWEKFADE